MEIRFELVGVLGVLGGVIHSIIFAKLSSGTGFHFRRCHQIAIGSSTAAIRPLAAMTS